MQAAAPRPVMVPAMPTVVTPALAIRTVGPVRPPLLLPLPQVGIVAIPSAAMPPVGMLEIRTPILPTPATPLGTLVMPVTAGLVGVGLLLLPLLAVLAGMQATPRALAGTPASPVPRVAQRTRRPHPPAIRVTVVTPAATAGTVAPVPAPRAPRMAGQVVPPGMVRALRTAALLVTQGLVKQVPARPPTVAPAVPPLRTSVEGPPVARVPGIAVGLVVVTAGRPRPVLARVVPVMLPAALGMPRVTRAAVLAVPEAAVPVVVLRVPPERAEPHRVAPGRAVPLPAVTAVLVVLPMPALVRPVRVAQVRPLRPVPRTAALAGPVVPARAVPVVMLPAVQVRLLRPAPVVQVRAVRVATAPVRVGIPLRVGSPRSVVRRRPAPRLAPLVVTLRRTAEMLPGRPGTPPPRRVTVQSVGRVVTPGRVVLVPSAVTAVLVARAVPVVPRPPVPVARVLRTTPASTPVQPLRRRVELAVATRSPRRPGLRRTTGTLPGPARPTPAIRLPVSRRTGSAPMVVSTSAVRISVWRTSGITTRASSTTVTFSAC